MSALPKTSALSGGRTSDTNLPTGGMQVTDRPPSVDSRSDPNISNVPATSAVPRSGVTPSGETTRATGNFSDDTVRSGLAHVNAPSDTIRFGTEAPKEIPRPAEVPPVHTAAPAHRRIDLNKIAQEADWSPASKGTILSEPPKEHPEFVRVGVTEQSARPIVGVPSGDWATTSTPREGIMEKAKDVTHDMADKVKHTLGMDKGTSTTPSSAEHIADKASWKTTEAKDYAKEKGYELKGKMDRAGEKVSDVAHESRHGVIGAMESAKDTIVEKATEAKDWVGEKMHLGGEKAEKVAEKAEWKTTEAKDFAKEKGYEVKGKMDKAGEKVSDVAHDTKKGAMGTVESVKETIAEKAAEARDWVGEKTEEVKDYMKEKAQSGKDVVEHAGDKASWKTTEAKDFAKEKGYEAKGKMDKAGEWVSDKTYEAKMEAKKLAESEPVKYPLETDSPFYDTTRILHEMHIGATMDEEELTELPSPRLARAMAEHRPISERLRESFGWFRRSE